MKIAGIAGLLAVVTAVTGAAIPNVNAALNEVHQATGAVDGLLKGNVPSEEVTQLANKLEKVETALKGLQNEKRDVLSDTLGGVTGDLLKRDVLSDTLGGVTGDLLKRDVLGDTLDGVTGDLLKRDDAISGLAGQLLPSLTKQGILPEVTDLKQLTGLLNVLNANSLLSNVEQVLGGLLNNLPLKGLPVVGDLLGGLKRDDPISGLAGQLLPSLTKQGILPEVTDLKQLTGLLNVLNANSLLSNVEQVLGGLLNNLPLKGLPVVGDLLGGLKRDDPISGLAGQLLPSLTKQGVLPEVTDLKQLTGLLNVLNANSLLSNVEQVLGGLLNNLPLKGLPVVGDLLGGLKRDVSGTADSLLNEAGSLVDGAVPLKRDDPISGLAGQLLPSLTKQGVLPEVTDLKQLTGLLNVLNANSLLSNVEQVLGGLLNNLPLKGLPVVGDLLGGLKRDDPISSLAGQLLPSLTKQGILPEVTDLKQLTGLLNVLNANSLLGNVEQLLGGLLNGNPLKGLL